MMSTLGTTPVNVVCGIDSVMIEYSLKPHVEADVLELSILSGRSTDLFVIRKDCSYPICIV